MSRPALRHAMRMWCTLCLAALVGCGGKVLDGTCSLGDAGDGWSCTTTPAQGPGVVTQFAECPSSFDPIGSCPGNSGWSGPSDPGFVGVFSAGDDCFTCGSNGQGTHWICRTSWQAVGSYRCTP